MTQIYAAPYAELEVIEKQSIRQSKNHY